MIKQIKHKVDAEDIPSIDKLQWVNLAAGYIGWMGARSWIDNKVFLYDTENKLVVEYTEDNFIDLILDYYNGMCITDENGLKEYTETDWEKAFVKRGYELDLIKYKKGGE